MLFGIFKKIDSFVTFLFVTLFFNFLSSWSLIYVIICQAENIRPPPKHIMWAYAGLTMLLNVIH